MNTLGNVFLHSDRIEKAVLVFEFNFYFFRYDPYIIGSYAKGLAVQGETKKAKEFYERALKIHPENKCVKRLYEELQESESDTKKETKDLFIALKSQSIALSKLPYSIPQVVETYFEWNLFALLQFE